MARFGKLELGKDQSAPADAAPVRSGKVGERDEAYWLKQADEHRRSGQYENALRLYSRALELDKSLVAGWVGQVQMLVLLDEWREADLWSRKALELFPGNGDLMAGRAQAYCRMGDKKQAYAQCDGAMKQNGQSAYRWLVRGEIMVAGRQEMDGPCFEKAQQLDPDWLMAVEIALVYLYYRQPSKALGRVRRAVELGADRPYPWYVQGRCQRELGLAAQAGKSFARCLELSPRHVDALQALAAVDSGGWSPWRTVRRWLGRS